jgi:hypothetical protein
MHTGDSDKGWIHIEGRHITGVLPNPKGGPSDLFAPGTTRQQLERAADIIVKKGVRISDPNNVIQVFEKRMKINGSNGCSGLLQAETNKVPSAAAVTRAFERVCSMVDELTVANSQGRDAARVST